MNMRMLAASGLALAATVSTSALAAPSVYFAAPRDEATISGSLSGSACEARGSSIRSVRFYLGSTALNTESSSPWNCSLDTRKFRDGRYQLRAVAYDSSGVSRSTQVDVNIRNASSSAAPTVAFQAPAPGGPLSGNVQGPPHCVVTGSNIARVMFYLDGQWTNTDGNLSNGLGCWIDTTKHKDGAYTLKAVAYNSAGQTAEATREIVIANNGGTSGAPSVSFQSPAPGGALSGNVQGPPHCVVTGSNVARVMFYLNGQWTNTDGNLDNGLGCWIDTTKHPDGPYTLKAVAYNSAGQSAEATRDIVIANNIAAGPKVSFLAPASSGTLIGNYSNSDRCEVAGEGISKVDFYLNATKLNTDTAARWQCGFDSKQFANGAYTLKAVAFDAKGASSTVQIPVTVQNAVSGGNNPPEVSILAPAAGAKLSGHVNSSGCEASARDADGKVAKVEFFLSGKPLGSKTAAPYQCAIDTQAFPNGSHTLMAVATDDKGKSAAVQRTVSVSNADDTPEPGAGAVDSRDIVHEAQAGVPFSNQSGYNTQVIATYLSANQIPESGINGTVLPNGERLRLGKQADPLNSTKKALAFQLAYNDPITSGSKRAEIKFPAVIEMNKVYWAAFSVYAYDWGSLPSGENAMFAMQLHAGNTSTSLSPSISVIAGKGGRTWWIDSRTSTASSPSQSNSYSTRSADQPIRFGRWMDVVVKFKLNTSGAGLVQVWADGTQIFNHQGSVGYNTGSVRPYFKFGYYNWNSFKGTRKVLLRSPVVVADPTGSKYTPQALRAFVASQ